MNEAQITEIIDNMADLFAHSRRTPVLHTPDEYGMAYEDIFFPAMDGITIEGWFIPAEGSDKLIIANHCLPANRSGFPGHLSPWNELGFGDFEVNFLPKYKALHDAGYNVLVYDMRNHGRSGAGSGGLVGHGTLEYRDVIGSIRYANGRTDTKDMKKALLSVCLGANSTIAAMHKHPEEFDGIQTLFAIQPVTAGHFVKVAMENMGIENGYERFSRKLYEVTGFKLENLWPTEWAKAVKIPTKVAQLRTDSSIRAEELLPEIVGQMSTKEKELYWIEGSTQRFFAYNYFGKHPEVMLDWFSRHLK